MAKYERYVKGDFDQVLDFLDKTVRNGSLSVTLEESTALNMGNVRMAMRAYERYSLMGSNRVSLTFTLIGDGQRLFVSAMSTGGSQGMLFKINTLGEHSFLKTLVPAIESIAEQD
jgi:hypothetical protein